MSIWGGVLPVNICGDRQGDPGEQNHLVSQALWGVQKVQFGLDSKYRYTGIYKALLCGLRQIARLHRASSALIAPNGSGNREAPKFPIAAIAKQVVATQNLRPKPRGPVTRSDSAAPATRAFL